MSSIPYSRGSEWRRWDLHIHTKDTVKNDQFTSSDFSAFCNILFRKALEKKIYAIGITDYFNIDNYKKVKSFIQKIDSNGNFSTEEKKKLKNILIIPNVELRMLPVTDKNRLVNIHCLFNPDFEGSLDNSFFNKIEHYNGPGTKYPMNRSGIIDLGKSLDGSLTSEDEQYKKGIENFTVSHESLQALFEGNPSLRENAIIVISNSNVDGASGFQKHFDFFEGQEPGSLDGVRKAIYCISDMIFSSNDNDRSYFLGKKSDDINTIITKCGSVKPCIHGSDAHKEDDLFSPDNDKFCWIKSDLTFEGLKQVLYEPEDRVMIQELKPQEKPSYQLIDRVRFIDNAFTQDDILINKNLTTIIGGKSTGKSILLRNIAQTIDPIEVSSRLNEVGLQGYSEEVSDFEVVWKDGQISKKTQLNSVNKKIIYIPQSYLNRLVDKEEDKTSIDDIIKNVLEQESSIKEVFDELDSNKREIEKLLTQSIEELFYKENDRKTLIENIKKIGDKKGLESEILKVSQEIEILKKKSGMTQQEIAEYDSLSKENSLLKIEKQKHENDIKILEYIKGQLGFNPNPLIGSLSPEIKKSIIDSFSLLNEKYQSDINQILDEKIIEIQELSKNILLKISEGEMKLDPLVRKIIESKALEEKLNSQKEQENRLKIIIDEEKKLEILTSEYTDLVNLIIDKHSGFFDILFKAKGEILKQGSITEDKDLQFDIDIIFQNKTFQEKFIDDVCNLRYINQFEEKLLENYNRSNNSGFREDIEKIIKGILSEKLILKSSYSRKEAITRITKCWFDFDYKISQNGDEISEMSPGKKSFVLLKLLIELDNSSCPILLDQPEDDLDNRSIYNDLVKFIKEKKKNRQIIIATHNPNLVVGADAECVIVANQKGEGAENKIYDFEYVEGSLENSFNSQTEQKILYKQGIQEHVCDILEGGKIAFEQRKNKYNF